MRSSSRPRPRSARLLKEASTAIRPPTPSSSMPSRECWPRRPACCCRRTCLPSRQIAGANVPGGDFQKSSIKIPGYEFSFVPLSPTQDAGGAPRAKNTAPLPPHHSFIAPIYAPHSRGGVTDRSEEHTSELQSPDHLVCRLLLEKKKKKKQKVKKTHNKNIIKIHIYYKMS